MLTNRVLILIYRFYMKIYISTLLILAIVPIQVSLLTAAELNPFKLKDPLIGKAAPEIETEIWFNSEPLSLKSLRGKVVIIEFFQLWCPGCNSFSIPVMTKWRDKTFAGQRDIAFLSVHTVFEGHDYQSNERLRLFISEKNMTHPVAVDKSVKGNRIPLTMAKYRTGGTPCIAIIDKNGIVRFKYLGSFKTNLVESFIRELLMES